MLPETKGKSLEELTWADAGVAHGRQSASPTS
jgi:hypothetical protein